MMKKTALWMIAIGLLMSAGLMNAQDTSQQSMTTANSDTTHSDVRTMTGCLQKGDGANEYALTGRDGSTWEVRSDTVDLASHVGQTVTITGAVRNAGMHGMKEDMKKEAQEHGMDKGATEHGHLTATQLDVTSSHCSQ